MARRAYGDCIGCKRPIAPPYLQFVVQRLEQEPGQDPIIQSWEEVDCCDLCAAKLSAEDLYRLVNEPELEEAQP